MTAFAFSFLFPFLLVMALVQWLTLPLWRRPLGWRPTLLHGMISALIVLIPFKGLFLGRWVISINANFCIPLTAIVLGRVLEAGFGVSLLDRKALLASWIFGLAAGMVLYPMALGLGRFDPYGLGWGLSWLFLVLLATTVVLLFLGNRLGIILMASVLCYDLNLLESHNLWDYLVDPFFVLISVGALGRQLTKRICAHKTALARGEG